MILDFGPSSVADLKRQLGEVKTVLWNGPLGAFETAPFGEGTFALAREVARLTRENKLRERRRRRRYGARLSTSSALPTT